MVAIAEILALLGVSAGPKVSVPFPLLFQPAVSKNIQELMSGVNTIVKKLVLCYASFIRTTEIESLAALKLKQCALFKNTRKNKYC